MLVGLLFLAMLGMAQKTKVQLQYIENHYKIAIAEMKQFGIPASITLAQGLLESAAGKSYLAVEGNNHFGIKCHRDWQGKRLYRDDDEKNECFRGYESVAASYRDHSEFLKYRSRYAFLFEESPTDYKAWAKGLKKAGYATDRQYPKRLISLIELYELHKYDLDGFEVEMDEVVAPKEDEAETPLAVSQINVSKNYVKFVTVDEDDTFESLVQDLRVSAKRLLKYNDYDSVPTLKAGDRLYIQPKRRRAYREFKTYTVKEGDSMHSISQQFGIKLKHLYRRNPELKSVTQPAVGTVLELR
jgi:LysM repeat protein